MQLQAAGGQEGCLHYPHSSLGHCCHRTQPLQEADVRAFRMILPQPVHMIEQRCVPVKQVLDLFTMPAIFMQGDESELQAWLPHDR